MSKIENLEAFYKHKFNDIPSLPPVDAGGFKVFNLTETTSQRTPLPYARYDFFKIMLIRGNHRCHYADKSINLNGSTLIFFNPSIPYKFERIDKEATGFFCVFKESFFIENHRHGNHDLPMFSLGGKTVYHLNDEQDNEIAILFEKIITESNSQYKFKYQLLFNLVNELIHYAIKMEPNEHIYHHPDTNSRITSIFTELLEQQFPIETVEQSINLRTASDFAEKLAVHVNHLNRAIRSTTGKTTTNHINERLVAEAIALLKHTNWNIADISYCLGFTQPAHFTHFFKKHTNSTPTSVRLV
ncbi:AraC family transcriptional regulator [Flavobacterium sp. J27]|uniref:helix-turn-helix domain-containing protein n=1 Tax=Flavobacterium sp. J27 TaxID=2060419 RepID=UPI00103019D2|nr:AraC family transcriptional regulator [Flavobacterium sp. J27]